MMSVLRWAVASLEVLSRDARPVVMPLLGEIYRARFSHPVHGTTPSSYVFFDAEMVAAKPATVAVCANNCRCGWEVTGSFAVQQPFFGQP